MIRRDFLKTIGALVASGSVVQLAEGEQAPDLSDLHPLKRPPLIWYECRFTWQGNPYMEFAYQVVRVERNEAQMPDMLELINRTNRRPMLGAGQGQLKMETLDCQRCFEEWHDREVEYWRNRYELAYNPQGWDMYALTDDGRTKCIGRVPRAEFPPMLEVRA